ncbi:MAG: tetraacyldisaccharide 4'-kinase [Proteobacteria bacterium]|nr:tetraacyldisaccharide 4'-kinase [Pseudomonadota bacterium]
MKAPSFWYAPDGFLSSLLSPLGWFYGKGGRLLRTLKTPQRFSIPIISMGNIICGGSGKTPTAIALAHLLQKRGIEVHFVTRGYGGALQGPVEVTSSHHPSDVGDEPLLLAQHAPTWVAKNRPLGVQKAIESGAQLLILDDGHQTSSLYKDISFVVLNALQGFGNGRVIPAGPLREDRIEGLNRADALIEIGEGNILAEIPLFKAKTIPQSFSFSLNRVVAFCGLGFPQKFYRTLEDLGLTLVATKSFPDHHTYTEKELLELQSLAKMHHALLITTRKDWVKLPPSWQKHLHVLDIEVQFEDPEGICNFIFEKIPHLNRPHPCVERRKKR